MGSNSRRQIKVDGEYRPARLRATTLSFEYLEPISHNSQCHIILAVKKTVAVAKAIDNNLAALKLAVVQAIEDIGQLAILALIFRMVLHQSRDFPIAEESDETGSKRNIPKDLATMTTFITALFIAVRANAGFTEGSCKGAAAVHTAVIPFFGYSSKLSDSSVQFVWGIKVEASSKCMPYIFMKASR